MAMISYLDQGNRTYYRQCLASASNKVPFQFDSFSFVSVAEKRRDVIWSGACKKWELILPPLSLGQLGCAVLCCSRQNWAISLPRTGFHSKSCSTKSGVSGVDPQRSPCWTRPLWGRGTLGLFNKRNRTLTSQSAALSLLSLVEDIEGRAENVCNILLLQISDQTHCYDVSHRTEFYQNYSSYSKTLSYDI